VADALSHCNYDHGAALMALTTPSFQLFDDIRQEFTTEPELRQLEEVVGGSCRNTWGITDNLVTIKGHVYRRHHQASSSHSNTPTAQDMKVPRRHSIYSVLTSMFQVIAWWCRTSSTHALSGKGTRLNNYNRSASCNPSTCHHSCGLTLPWTSSRGSCASMTSQLSSPSSTTSRSQCTSSR
jgi:hypothetical protein